MELKFNKTVTVLDGDIDDIMVTAFEGGITYWCGEAHLNRFTNHSRPKSKRSVAEMLSQGEDIILEDFEASVAYVLTLEKFIKGLKRWLEEGGNLDNYDATDADKIIQYALFNELVYA